MSGEAHHNLLQTAMLAVTAAPSIEVHGARIFFVGRVPGERLDHRRQETVLRVGNWKTIYVEQHIQLTNGSVIAAPWLEARGFG